MLHKDLKDKFKAHTKEKKISSKYTTTGYFLNEIRVKNTLKTFRARKVFSIIFRCFSRLLHTLYQLRCCV